MPAAAIADSSPAPEAADLVPSVSITNLLSRREAVLERLRAIQGAVREIEDLATAIGLSGEDHCHIRSKFLLPISEGRYSHLRFTADDWLAQATAHVDAALWDLLLHQSGLRTFMDHRARKEWDEQIDKNQTPPLTRDNIESTFRNLHAARGELFERGVLGVFRALSWDYKSNLPHRFGARLILRYVVSEYGHASYDQCNHLDDLLRVFHLVDGRPEPDHRQGVARRLNTRPAGENLEDEYVRIRTFKNGNAHIYFLRTDLVDALNRIIAKHHPNALPPQRE